MREGLGAVWLPVTILAVFVVLVFLGMWHGWRRRGRKHDLPPLEPVADGRGPAVLEAAGRYVGTTVAGEWLDRVVARGLGSVSGCRLRLTEGGLDVHRPAGSFRVPAAAILEVRQARGLAGSVVPPRGLLVVTWRHGDYVLDTGFRLTDPSGAAPATAGHPAEGSVSRLHEAWARSIEAIVEEHAA